MSSSVLLTVLAISCCGPCGKGGYGYSGYGYGYGPPGYYLPATGYHVPHGYYVYPPSPYNPVYHGPRVPVAPLPLPAEKGKTLYDRLGGQAAIVAVVDDLVARASANPKVNFTRKGTPKEWKPTPENVAHVKKMLVELVGSATGGPQKYSGRSMKEVHAGMKITQAEFDALAADLKVTLDKLKVPAKEQDELMKIVASTVPDIVEKQKN